MLDGAAWITIRPEPEADLLPLRNARWIGPAEQRHPDASRFLATVVDFVLPKGRAIREAHLWLWVEGRSYFDPTFDVPKMADQKAEWGFCRLNGSSEIEFREMTPLIELLAPRRMNIGHMVRPGANRLAFLSWMALPEPSVIAAIEWVFEDGKTGRLVSDAAWRCQILGLEQARAADWHDRLDHTSPCHERAAFGGEPWTDIRGQLNHPQAPVVLRRRFTLPARPIASARIAATAIGAYDMELNGRRVGDVHLAPGWTDTRKAAHIQTYDAAGMLAPGENLWQATVAKGWTGSPMQGCVSMREDIKALRATLEVRYAGGETIRIPTEAAGWEGGDGEVRDSEIYDGETVDRTHAPVSRPVVELPARETRCVSEPCAQPRVVREFPPLSITPRGEGTWIVDFGQSFSGVVRLRVDEPAGTRVLLRHAEALRKDGGLMTVNLRAAHCADSVVCDGKPFVFQPRFTFRGFRYVEISGLSREPAPEDIRGIALSSVGRATFEGVSSFPQLDRLIEAIRWTQLSNWLSVPTDCPQRSERLAWQGDNQFFAPSGLLLFDGKDFQAKHLADILESPNEATGSPPEFAPNGGGAGPAPSYGYADAAVTLPYNIWRIYGDLGAARRHWEKILGYLRSLDLCADADGLVVHGSYGDWLTTEPKTPHAIMAPIMQAKVLAQAAELAKALGDPATAAACRKRNDQVNAVWRDRHLRPDGTIESDNQAVYVCAWRFGLIPEHRKPQTAAAMRRAFERHDRHIRTGICGTASVLDALIDAGHLDIAWRILSDDAFPSYGYFLKNGATTLPEWWDPWPGEHETTEYWKTFEGDRSQGEFHGSMNHPVFGAVFEGIFKHVWGLRQAPGGAGFREVIIQPRFTGRLESFDGVFHSVSGTYKLAWRRQDGAVHYRISVPEGCEAALLAPQTNAPPLFLKPGDTSLAIESEERP